MERISGAATDSGAAAVSAAEVLIGGLVDRVADVVTKLREKQPMISIAIVIVKDNNLASPGGQIRDLGDADADDAPPAANGSTAHKHGTKKKH